MRSPPQEKRQIRGGQCRQAYNIIRQKNFAELQAFTLVLNLLHIAYHEISCLLFLSMLLFHAFVLVRIYIFDIISQTEGTQRGLARNVKDCGYEPGTSSLKHTTEP